MWKSEASGNYTTKSFCRYTLSTSVNVDGVWKQVWANIAPHWVEIFVWQLLQGKIGVKEEFVKRGVNLNSDLQCVLCNVEKETCDHLFVNCNESWKIWTGWCRLWGTMWISQGKVKELFVVWNKWQLGGLDVRI